MKVFLDTYTAKNLGDDLFLKIISEKYPSVKFSIHSHQKDYLHKNNITIIGGAFHKITNFLSNKIRNPSLHTLNKIKTSCDAEIILGGSMFIEDEKSEEGIKYDIHKKYTAVKKPLFVIGSNFGPYKNEYYRSAYEKLFSQAEDVCFRDKKSKDLFKKIKNIRVAPDVVFNLNIAPYKEKTEKKVIISVIDLSARTSLSKCTIAYEQKIADIAKEYADNGYDVVLMSFCKSEGDEAAIDRILHQLADNKKVKAHRYNGDIDSALREISSSEIIIGTRFHSVILGLLFNKQVAPIIYSEKTKNALDYLGYNGDVIAIENISDFNPTTFNFGKIKDIEQVKTEAAKQFNAFTKFCDGAKNV